MGAVLRRSGRWMRWMLSATLTVVLVVTGVLVVTIDRLPALLSALAGHFVPAFELDLGRARLHGWSGLELHHVVLRPRGESTPLVSADRVELRFTPDGLRRAHIDEIRLVAPTIDVPETLPDTGGDGGEPARWSIGRLVAENGWVRVAASGDRPGARADVAFDLRALGTTPDLADRRHRVRLRRLDVAWPDQPPLLVADAAIARFTTAGLLARQRLDELRLVRAVVTVPETLPAVTRAGGEAPPSAWSLGRLVIPDGRLRAAATADRPGVTLDFRVDLQELGLAPAQAARRQRLRLHDVNVHLAGRRAPSLVLDEAHVDFTLRGLLDARRIERVRIHRGIAVLDQTLRAQLAGGGASGAPGGPEWQLGRLDVLDLGVRVADLGLDIPDVTLVVRTVLRDVPLGPRGLARASDRQRLELGDLTFYSPLDPFRRVVRIPSIFVEFTLGGLVRERLEAITLVSPTIYVGEDLIWYMDAQRRQTASAEGTAPGWTVGRVSAELGRVVFTFEGTDRLQLPITFRSTARDVDLADLASLRLAADLQVPRQSYRFPGFDVRLVDIEGTLRFDYPPGRADENVVNVLRAAEVRWGDYAITDAWMSLTVDASGINGDLGGSAYSGYTNVGLSVPYSAGDRSAWISGDRVDLAPLTTALSNGRAVMTGRATFEAALTLRDERIDAASGHLTLLGPGEVDFPDLDTLPERLPADAPSWQRDLARIGAEAFRDWPWTSGEGTLSLAHYRGVAELVLTGERGARRVEAHYYQDAPVLAGATPAAP